MHQETKHGFGNSSTQHPHVKHANEPTTPAAHESHLIEHADQLISEGKTIDAEKIYLHLIVAGTNNHVVYGNLGALYGMQKQYEKAIPLLNTALQIMANYSEGLFNLGLAQKETGHLEAAIIYFDKAVSQDQSYAAAHYQLGCTYQKLGNLESAVKSYQQALNANPDLHEARMQLGITHYEKYDFMAAINCYEDLIQSIPANPEVYNNLGNALLKQGQVSSAIRAFQTAIKLLPEYPEAYLNLGNAYRQFADPANAMACYRRALELNSKLPEALVNSGTILQEQGHLDAAIAHYKAGLRIRQAYPDALINLGNALRKQGYIPESILCFQSCLAIKPDLPEAHLNLGVVQLEQGDADASIECFKSALSLRPDYPDALLNYGNALQEKGDVNSSIHYYQKAIELYPDYAEAHLNLGVAYRNLGCTFNCIASYQKALEIKPSYPEAHINLGHALLSQGNYKSGWEEYEWRLKLKCEGVLLDATPPSPRWSGSALKADEQLVVLSEQGLGDSLQFMRYINVLRNLELNVRFGCPTKLHGLVQSSGLDRHPLSLDEAASITEGHWIQLASLPHHLGVSAENPIATAPYIQAPEDMILKWKYLLQTEKRPIIGINWKGNRQDNQKHERSIELELFRSLVGNQSISLLSLQRGERAQEEIQDCSFASRFVSIQCATSAIANSNASRDFLEYAAIVANCDIIITSATTLAHLAGGMGKPTYTLVPAVPDWRWGLEGDSCFWYPSMRLFRQQRKGDWCDVMTQVAAHVKSIINS